jgi:hypothetical protein
MFEQIIVTASVTHCVVTLKIGLMRNKPKSRYSSSYNYDIKQIY